MFKNTFSNTDFILLAAAGMYLYLSYDIWSAIGVFACVLLLITYIKRLGKTIPILELMLLISAFQWIFGAHQAYKFDEQHYKYYMYVDREEYMPIIVPGFLAFLLGTIIFYPKYNLEEVKLQIEKIINKNKNMPLVLVAMGLVLPEIGKFLPSVIGFIFFLFGSFKYVGAVLWLFKPDSSKQIYVTILVLSLTLLGSLRTGMFHELLLWLVLMFSFISYKYNLSNRVKTLLLVIGFFFVFILQSIKFDYREIIYSGAQQGKSNFEVFVDLAVNRIFVFNELLSDNEYMAELNVRLNQGWIISSIIYNVPDFEPFAEGETIYEAFEASLLPRFLAPDKKIAGGRENFLRFTGLPLGERTSMGTSTIGEAYANYGKQGSWLFMFFWGAFLSLVYKLLVRYGNKNAIIHIFLPLIFLQVIKAETETYVALNHLTKSLILVFLFLFFARKVLKWQV